MNEELLKELHLYLGGDDALDYNEFKNEFKSSAELQKMLHEDVIGGESAMPFTDFLTEAGVSTTPTKPKVSSLADLNKSVAAGKAAAQGLTEATDNLTEVPSRKPQVVGGTPYSWSNGANTQQEMATPLYGSSVEEIAKPNNNFYKLEEKLKPIEDGLEDAKNTFLETVGNFASAVGSATTNMFSKTLAERLTDVAKQGQIDATNESNAIEQADIAKSEFYKTLTPEDLAPVSYNELYEGEANFSTTREEAVRKTNNKLAKHTNRLKEALDAKIGSLSPEEQILAGKVLNGEEVEYNPQTSSPELNQTFDLIQSYGTTKYELDENVGQYNTILKQVSKVIGEAKNNKLDAPNIKAAALEYLTDLKSGLQDPAEIAKVDDIINITSETMAVGGGTTDIAESWLMGTVGKLFDTGESIIKGLKSNFYTESVFNLTREDKVDVATDEAQDVIRQSLQEPRSSYTGSIKEEVIDKGGRRLVVKDGQVIDIRKTEDNSKIFYPSKEDIAIIKSFDPKTDKTRKDYRGSAIVNTTGQVLTDMVPMLAIGAATGGSTLGMMAGSTAVSYGSFYKQALADTGDMKKATLFAALTAPIIGYVESKIGSVEGKLSRTLSAVERKGIYDTIINVTRDVADKGIEAYIKGPGIAVRIEKALTKAKEFGGDVFGEWAEEFSNIPVEALAGNITGVKTQDFTIDSFEETAILTTLAAGSMSGANIMLNNKNDINELIGYAATKKEAFNKVADEWVEAAPNETEKKARLKDVAAKKQAVSEVEDTFKFIEENEFDGKQKDMLTNLSLDKARAVYKLSSAESSKTKAALQKEIADIDTKMAGIQPITTQVVEETPIAETKKEFIGRDLAGGKKVFTDFDNTLYNPKTGELTAVGKELRDKLDSGELTSEDVEILTARDAEQAKEVAKFFPELNVRNSLSPEAKAAAVAEANGNSIFIDDNKENLAATTSGEVIDANTVVPQTPKELNKEEGVDNTPTGTKAAQTTTPEKVQSFEETQVVSDYENTPVTYKGQRGTLKKDGNIWVVETPTTIFELDGVAEADSLSKAGVEVAPEVTFNEEDNYFTIRGNSYVNLFSDPLSAITTDADGNYVVRLDTGGKNSQPRNFRGQLAEDLAYQITLQKITKDNGKEFEEFINEADTNGEIPKPDTEAAVSTDAEVPVEQKARVKKQAPQAPEITAPALSVTTPEKVPSEVSNAATDPNKLDNFTVNLSKGKTSTTNYVKGSDGKWRGMNSKGTMVTVTTPNVLAQLEAESNKRVQENKPSTEREQAPVSEQAPTTGGVTNTRKTKTNDSKDNTGIPSEEQGRETPIQAQPNQEGGGSQVEGSGVLQAQEGELGKPQTEAEVLKGLEVIGKTSKEREDQIYKFFALPAALGNKKKAREIAKVTNNLWENIAIQLGKRSGKTANDWIQSRVAMLGKTTVAGAKTLGGTKFQIIGEKGAAALDAAQEANTRINDLVVAKEMEAADKDAKTIKLATGWEKGADNKWKYEIGDGRMVEGVDFNKEGLTLGEVYVNEELFKAYPELSRMKIRLVDLPFEINGGFNDLDNTIDLNKNRIEDALFRRKLNKTLEHETAHVVQQIEGFNRGGNPGQFFRSILNRLGSNIGGDEQYGNEVEESAEYQRAFSRAIEGPFRGEFNRLKEYKGESLNIFARKLANDMYDSLAGEVEARNIEERLRYTPEQRKNILLQETEGVPREYQITLQESFDDLANAIDNGSVKLQGENTNTQTLPEAATNIANNLITELDRMIAERSNPSNIKARKITQTEALKQINELRAVKAELQANVKDSRFQEDGVFRAAAIELANNQVIIAALDSPNESSFVHEMAHSFEPDLTTEERQTFIDEYNDKFGDKVDTWNTDVSEYFARTWEKYLSNGRKVTEAEVKDPKTRGIIQSIFDKFTSYLQGIYNGVIEYNNGKVSKEITLSPAAKAVFDKIMNIETTNTGETTLDETTNTGPNAAAAETDPELQDTPIENLKPNDPLFESDKFIISGKLINEDISISLIQMGGFVFNETQSQSFKEAVYIANNKGYFSKDLSAETDIRDSVLLGNPINSYQEIALQRAMASIYAKIEAEQAFIEAAEGRGDGNTSILEERKQEFIRQYELFALAYQKVGTDYGRGLVYRKLAQAEDFRAEVVKERLAKEFTKIGDNNLQAMYDLVDKIDSKRRELIDLSEKVEEEKKKLIKERAGRGIANLKKDTTKVQKDPVFEFQKFFATPTPTPAKVKFQGPTGDTSSTDGSYSEEAKLNIIKDFARHLVRAEGINSLKELTERIINEYESVRIPNSIELTADDVYKALALSSKEEVTKKVTEYQKNISKIRSEASRFNKLSAMINNRIPEKNVTRPKLQELDEMDKLIRDLQKIFVVEASDFGFDPSTSNEITDDLEKISRAIDRVRIAGDLSQIDLEAKNIRTIIGRINGQMKADRLQKKLDELRAGKLVDTKVSSVNSLIDVRMFKLKEDIDDARAELKNKQFEAKAWQELAEKYGEHKAFGVRKVVLAYNAKSIKDNWYEYPRRYVLGGDIGTLFLQGGFPQLGILGQTPVQLLSEEGRRKIAYNYSTVGQFWAASFKGLYGQAVRGAKKIIGAPVNDIDPSVADYQEMMHTNSGVFAKQMGLALNRPFAAQLAKDQDEFFANKGLADLKTDSKVMRKVIDVIDMFEKVSEGAYTMGVNSLRLNMFNAFKDSNRDATIQQLKDYANFVNDMTGTSNVNAQGLSRVLLAPRLYWSRIKLIGTLPKSLVDLKTPEKRLIAKEKIKWVTGFSSGFALTAMLMALLGYDLEDDPRDNDFLKFKKGRKTIDLTAGVGKWFAMAATIPMHVDRLYNSGRAGDWWAGEHINTSKLLRNESGWLDLKATKRVDVLDEYNPTMDKPFDVFISRVGFSLHPTIRSGFSLVQGEDAVSKPLGTSAVDRWWNFAVNSTMPLSTQQLFIQKSTIMEYEKGDLKAEESSLKDFYSENMPQFIGINVNDPENNMKHLLVENHLNSINYDPKATFTTKQVYALIPELQKGYSEDQNLDKTSITNMLKREVYHAVGSDILENIIDYDGVGTLTEDQIKELFSKNGEKVADKYKEYYKGYIEQWAKEDAEK